MYENEAGGRPRDHGAERIREANHAAPDPRAPAT